MHDIEKEDREAYETLQKSGPVYSAIFEDFPNSAWAVFEAGCNSARSRGDAWTAYNENLPPVGEQVIVRWDDRVTIGWRYTPWKWMAYDYFSEETVPSHWRLLPLPPTNLQEDPKS